jgi:putative redox protein
MDVKATIRWTDGYQFVARAGDSPAVVMDSSEGKSGPTPMEMLLMGVAGCTAIDVLSIMNKKRTSLSGLEVNITGEKAEDHPKRYTTIHLEYVLYGRGVSSKAVEQAIELSKSKYCSAMASLNALFEHSYRIVEAGGSQGRSKPA